MDVFHLEYSDHAQEVRSIPENRPDAFLICIQDMDWGKRAREKSVLRRYLKKEIGHWDILAHVSLCTQGSDLNAMNVSCRVAQPHKFTPYYVNVAQRAQDDKEDFATK